MKNNKINWKDIEYVQSMVAGSKHLTMVLRKMGLSVKTSGNYNTLRKYIDLYNINTSHFNNGLKQNWNDIESIKNIINSSSTKTETLIKMGLSARSGNFVTLNKYIDLYNIDIKHFNPYINAHKIPPKLSDEEFFINGVRRNGQALRKKLVEGEMLKDECSKCGLKPIWNGESLVLQLEHIDGDSINNEVKNLTLLCPNCHSQTLTYAGRNNKMEL